DIPDVQRRLDVSHHAEVDGRLRVRQRGDRIRAPITADQPSLAGPHSALEGVDELQVAAAEARLPTRRQEAHAHFSIELPEDMDAKSRQDAFHRAADGIHAGRQLTQRHRHGMSLRILASASPDWVMTW